MIRRLLQAAVLSGLATVAMAQAFTSLDIPEKLQAPPGEKIVLQARASGWQIYLCQPGPDGKPAWTFKAPQAELRDAKGTVVGSHYAGPTWKSVDSSEVAGHVIEKGDSPTPDAIPWLLLSAVRHSADGVFSRVTSIQRIHTHGGNAPATGCDASKLNDEARISYTADYYFYAPAK